ncbi:MAG: hypothetical protein A2X19_04790 [Bacteroidetes bacterium GWE2_39_28]|nr:MAG: hypothetical protein A2X19_04790 [Bacteroidetes bacterium GWE2_39_28]OFY15323.1 MAG: hypothetical protein A2X16_09310 [Bacteroidetes bacterium GWF2_39_10]OFZ11170.1 MAG: hypothetical protein A2465_02550 [Bacteroidetes bacterium RIFOXYC2_FULL_39_11]HCT93962.1 hypothetical protein [Rikenellaceae bacterium]HCV15744.1 hypothetical protein [Rikenellaceae bacterium]
MKKTIISLIFVLLFLKVTTVDAQQREHLIGVRAAYNISGLDSRPDISPESIKTYGNYSVVYTFYHDLWKTINLFGFQAAISKSEQGFTVGDITTRYEVVTIPLVSQFHFDFWKMRLLLNAGGFGGYRYKKSVSDGSGFGEHDYKADYGFIAGGGLAFVLKPFELHLEGNYHYSLSYLHSPKKFSETEHFFTYPKQLLISATLYFHL